MIISGSTGKVWLFYFPSRWREANPLHFHSATSPPALIQFRVYDCNTETERVVKAEAAVMNARLLPACLFWGRRGAGLELNLMLTCLGAFL